LKRIGRALHVSSSKNIILKAENLPKIGDKVIDENLRSLGIISDIFGPVSAPYISVKTDAKEPHHLVDHVLYTIPSNPPREKRRKRK